MNQDKTIALLIDADNISYTYINLIMEEIAKEGVITHKRIYGDWGAPDLASWNPAIINNALSPVQQIRYTSGKNATDSAMIIDAMDILYTGGNDAFCIVSSDSDFTKLAIRLRESCKYVLGMGEQKTPNSFVSACNRFKYLDVLQKSMQKSRPTRKEAPPPPPEPQAVQAAKATAERTAKGALPSSMPALEDIMRSIQAYVEDEAEDSDWVMQSSIGLFVGKQYPGFDVRNYGYRRLGELIKAMPDLETLESPSPQNPSVKHVMVRVRAH